MTAPLHVGLLTHMDVEEPTHRISFQGLADGLAASGHRASMLSDGSALPQGIQCLLSHVHVDFSASAAAGVLALARARGLPVLVHVNDFDLPLKTNISRALSIGDAFIVPTPLHAMALRALTDRPVHVLREMVDPVWPVTNPVRIQRRDGPLRVLWFGFAQSFARSMQPWQTQLLNLAEQGVVRYTVATKADKYGELTKNFFAVPYQSLGFAELLQEHDCCVLSHAPHDFKLNTLMKSENKLVLAIAAGLACVTSRTPAYQSLLEAVDLAQYAVADGQAMVRQLRIFEDPAARSEFLQKARPYVMRYYSQQAVTDGFVEIAMQFMRGFGRRTVS